MTEVGDRQTEKDSADEGRESIDRVMDRTREEGGVILGTKLFLLTQRHQ